MPSLVDPCTNAASATQVVVPEGPWEVLRLAQLDVPAVALLGTHLSSHQERLLSRWRRLAVLLDGDPAGRHATRRIAARLQATPVLLAAGATPRTSTTTSCGAFFPSNRSADQRHRTRGEAPRCTRDGTLVDCDIG